MRKMFAASSFSLPSSGLLRGIINLKSRENIEQSIIVPLGCSGFEMAVRHFSASDGECLVMMSHGIRLSDSNL